MAKNVHLISRWFILNGHQKEAKKVLAKFQEMANEEPGTLLYMIHRPMWNVNLVSIPTPQQLEVLFFEVYKDVNAFNQHLKRQVKFLDENNLFQHFKTLPGEPEKLDVMVEFLDYERGFIKKGFDGNKG